MHVTLFCDKTTLFATQTVLYMASRAAMLAQYPNDRKKQSCDNTSATANLLRRRMQHSFNVSDKISGLINHQPTSLLIDC